MSEFRYYQPIDIRYSDLDPQGHVNNAKFLTYMEQARIGYISHLGLWDGGSFLDVGIILADVHLVFRAPILFGQKVRVGVRVKRLGNKSLDMEYGLEDAESRQELASGSTVLVAYDYRAGRTISIPANWRQAIASFEGLSP
jgi:acyl-CoA thioester hydrolase